MQFVKKQSSIFFSSDPLVGAQNVNALGNRFSVQLPRPLSIPRNAVAAQIGILSASIWNTSPNIAILYTNNIFSATIGGLLHNITIPDGLYSLNDLGNFLSIQFVNSGLAANVITLSGNGATQQSIITYLNAGDTIHWGVASSVAPILGFNGSGDITSPSANWSSFSPNIAQFNRVNSYLITSDMISQGIPVNSQSANILGKIPITSAPGSQINAYFQIISFADASELCGSGRTNFSFALLDQSLRDVSTNGETYEFVIVIEYTVPLLPVP